eukprot:scaffold927_cov375-Prasinococcus_capsulatus_cf.AAC.12
MGGWMDQPGARPSGGRQPTGREGAPGRAPRGPAAGPLWVERGWRLADCAAPAQLRREPPARSALCAVVAPRRTAHLDAAHGSHRAARCAPQRTLLPCEPRAGVPGISFTSLLPDDGLRERMTKLSTHSWRTAEGTPPWHGMADTYAAICDALTDPAGQPSSRRRSLQRDGAPSRLRQFYELPWNYAMARTEQMAVPVTPSTPRGRRKGFAAVGKLDGKLRGLIELTVSSICEATRSGTHRLCKRRRCGQPVSMPLTGCHALFS